MIYCENWFIKALDETTYSNGFLLNSTHKLIMHLTLDLLLTKPAWTQFIEWHLVFQLLDIQQLVSIIFLLAFMIL
jgi:hypothetical protein